MLLDAHCTNESVKLVLETMKEKQRELEISCYRTWTRLLMENLNYIYLMTDGVLECGERPSYNFLKLVLHCI